MTVDHTPAGAAAATQSASSPPRHDDHAQAFPASRRRVGRVTQLKNEASQVFGFVTTDTKLTWQQIGSDLLAGKTLDQIAGANAAKVASDALAEVKAGLNEGVSRA